VHSKKSGKLKNNRSLGLMIVEQIQNLTATAFKAQLGGDARKYHLYAKPYIKRIHVLCMPCDYKPLKFQ